MSIITTDIIKGLPDWNQTINENNDILVNAINENSNKIGDLTSAGLTETDLATAIKNDRTQLSENAQQINNIFNVKRKIKNIVGISSNYPVTNWTFDKAFDGDVYYNVTKNNGWLSEIKPLANNLIKFSVPTGVIMGDSIAEGNNSLQGRVDYRNGVGVDLTRPNRNGQFSWHLEQYTKCKVYNHGIGGETTSQVRTRFNRDVLAQVDNSLTPTQTLDRKPTWVLFNVGINDLKGGVDINTTLANIEYMIDQCVANNIFVIFNTMPPYNNPVGTLTKIKQVNDWLYDKEKSINGMMKVTDYYSYFNDTNNDGNAKAGYTSDGLHPTRTYYQKFAEEVIIPQVFNKSLIPLVPRYINLLSCFDIANQVGGVFRPVAIVIRINDKIKRYCRLANEQHQVVKIPKTDEIMDTITIEIIESNMPTELVLENISSYPKWATGFSEIYLTDSTDKLEAFSEDYSIIHDLPTLLSYCNRNFLAKFDSSGNVTVVNAVNDTNILGVFADVVTSAGNVPICINGVCQMWVNTSVGVKKGDIITSNLNWAQVNYNPPAGTIIAEVLIDSTAQTSGGNTGCWALVKLRKS